MGSLTDGVDKLEKQFMAYAYACFAALVRDTFKSGFGAFVAIIPCATGITQFNARFDAKVPVTYGFTVTSSKNSSEPILGWEDPPSHISRKPRRIADPIPSIPEQAAVTVRMPNTEGIAFELMRRNATEVTAVMQTSRWAYDEPEMQAFLSEAGVGDVDVLTIHVHEVMANFTHGFQRQYRARSQFREPSKLVVESLSK